MEICRNCGARLSPDIDWCGQCFTPVERARAAELIVLPDADRRAARAIGIAGKLFYTALVIAFGVAAWAELRVLLTPQGTLKWGVSVLFLGILASFALVGLVLVWRPAPAGPRRSVIVVGGETIEQEPAREPRGAAPAP